MSSAEKPDFVSIDEYLRGESVSILKHEYIDGWVRAMTGATNRHNQVVCNATFALFAALKNRPCKPYNSDTKVRIKTSQGFRFYYPDAQVVCEPNPASDVFQDAPVFILEVLSPSTRQYDLDEKMTSYLSIPTLQVYLILEQHQPHAIIMRKAGESFLRDTIEGIDTKIALPFLACSLEMRDIYEGVEFTATCVQEPEPDYNIASPSG
jgi:Uma2 family endonuclease